MSQGRLRMFLGDTQEPHHQPNPQKEKHHSVQFFGTIYEIHGQKEVRTMLGPSHLLLDLDKHLRNQNVDRLYT